MIFSFMKLKVVTSLCQSALTSVLVFEMLERADNETDRGISNTEPKPKYNSK